jgi:hypothetical protein
MKNKRLSKTKELSPYSEDTNTKVREQIAQSIANKYAVQYRNLTPVPQTSAEIDEWADKMWEWVKKHKPTRIHEFPLKHNYNPYKFFALRDKSEYFHDQYIKCREFIATYIEGGWKSRKSDPSYCKAILPDYSQEYRERRYEETTKAIQSRQANATYVLQSVQMPDFPDSPLVPDKEDHGE